VSYELRTIKGDTLGKLVKCKSSKNFFQTNLPENLDISGLLTVFQRRLPDMFGSLLIPPVNRAYPGPLPGYSKVYRTCPTNSFFTAAKFFAGLIRPGNRILVKFPGHIRSLDQTCLAFGL
jgi:hypothetical protein